MVALVLTALLIALMHRDEFFGRERLASLPPRPVRYHRGLVIKTLVVTLAMVVLFFLGLPVARVAILAGALLLVTRRVKPEKVYFDIDWPLLGHVRRPVHRRRRAGEGGHRRRTWSPPSAA